MVFRPIVDMIMIRKVPLAAKDGTLAQVGVGWEWRLGLGGIDWGLGLGLWVGLRYGL
jgi:hypothetical protein